MTSASFERIGRNNFPLAVVKIRRAGVGRKIKRVILRATRLQVRANIAVFDLANHRIAVTPLSLDVCNTIGGSQIYDRIRQSDSGCMVARIGSLKALVSVTTRSTTLKKARFIFVSLVSTAVSRVTGQFLTE